MTPNQSGTTPTDTTNAAGEGDRVTATVLGQSKQVGGGGGDDPMLTTDCPSYSDAMSKQVSSRPQMPKQSRCDDENEGSEASTPSQKITIESIKGHSDEEIFEDDRSSVVTESSDSEDEEHVEGTFHEGLKRSADTLAVDAINCASDELQNPNGVICVQSQLRATPSPRAENGRVNKAFAMSEVGKPSRPRQKKRTGNEVAIKEPAQVLPVSSVTTATPLGPQTTAIFNDSSDITLGNKTFITGSLTIKQYIKESGPSELN